MASPPQDPRPPELAPLFLKLAGRKVLVVGGGPMAAAKLAQLAGTGALLSVVAPEVRPEIVASGVPVACRPFRPEDLDGAWLVIAAAPPEVNREVAAAAEAARVFVVAVDDPPSASAYGAGTLRRAGVTIAISTSGDAPALTGLIREALDALLPDSAELTRWFDVARAARAEWKARLVPMAERRPLLLRKLFHLYESRTTPVPAAPTSSASLGATP